MIIAFSSAQVPRAFLGLKSGGSTMLRKLTTLTLLAGLGLSGATQATLFDRGSGLIYDDVLKIT
jgi:hypothetical protein